MASSLATESILLLTLLFSLLQFSMGILLKGSVTCGDCSPSYNLSGVRIAVRCANNRMPYYAVTNAKGQFEVHISSRSSPPPPRNCTANLLGGPTQLCAFKKSMASRVVSVNSGGGESSGALQTPLAFFTSCQKMMEGSRVEKSGGKAAAGEQKAPNRGSTSPSGTPPTGGRNYLPPPESYGLPPLPPLIYIFPFVPIIGIP
ncbi:hypothetical protein HPP92_005471 [Vanilla planifolia]|uniref:Pollen Ole e 1 allergen and extensin family protein n=1 Tax=Vanilla planifolia TaxID=51239 RepID=A0A835RKB4_VANPL|nr:hypothetical protein HPP92_005471 [Vanilla planifolia]